MNCYIYNPSSKYDLPEEIMDKSITLFYPEAGMSTQQCLHSSTPRDFHIVTDCPYLVSLYSRHQVFYLERGKWKNPDFQTYGCSFDTILQKLWNYESSIPKMVLDGKVTNCMGSKLRYK